MKRVATRMIRPAAPLLLVAALLQAVVLLARGHHPAPAAARQTVDERRGGTVIGGGATAGAAPVPTTAGVDTTVVRPTSGRPAAALALIDYPWEALGYRIDFHGAVRGFLGTTRCEAKVIDVYERPSQTVRQLAFVTAFEIGHAIDCSFMTPARRNEWANLRGFDRPWRWFPPCTCSEDRYGTGDFAMVFASWLVPGGGYPWRSALAPPPRTAIADLLPYFRAAS